MNATANDISEEQALDILIAKIRDKGLYKSRLKFECLNFTNENETKKYFDFKVYENHNDKNCKGDKSTAPIVNRFRVSKLTGKIMRYEPIGGKFESYSEALKKK